MNIHITDKVLVDNLKNATIVKVVVGSHMYGTNNKNSDIDYLYIYATSENELLSVINTHHQLQYKEDGIDYLFVSLHTFINNILNGDSPINFEVINSTQLIGTELEWLYEMREYFITYTIIRSYLGICRRDIKHFHKCKTEYEKKKKLGHIIRGALYAEHMLTYKWDFDAINDRLNTIEINIEDNKQLRDWEKKVSNLRNSLNEQFNNGELKYAQKIDVNGGVELMSKLLNYCKSDKFKSKQNKLNDFDLYNYINSYENWVNYERNI